MTNGIYFYEGRQPVAVLDDNCGTAPTRYATWAEYEAACDANGAWGGEILVASDGAYACPDFAEGWHMLPGDAAALEYFNTLAC